MPSLRALILLTLALVPSAALCAPRPAATGATGAAASVPQQPTPLDTIATVREDADRDTVPDRKNQWVHIRGRVTVPTGALRSQGVYVFVQDATGGIALYNRGSALALSAGDIVEAWGRVELYRGAPQLEDARIQVVARGPSATPLAIGAALASDPAYQGRLIRTQGRIDTLSLDNFGLMHLTGDDGARLTVYVPEAVVGHFDWKHFPKGTRVRATGVMSIHKPGWPYNDGYQLVVYRPADLQVLQPPPPAWHRWLLGAIAAGAGVLGLGLLGLYVVRERQRARQNELQTLSALSAALAAADLGEQQLARRTCEILTAYRITEAAIAQIYDAEGCLRQVAVATADPSLEPALHETDPLCPPDPGGETHGRQIEARVAATGLGLMAIYPLPSSSGTIGFLIALSPRRRQPSRMQERTLLAAVKLLAMALEKARIQSRAREEQRELQHLVITDELTQLCNRRFLEEYLSVQIPLAVRRGRGLSFVALDIDHFKAVNDTYGHAVGDRVIAGVADLMRAASRSADLPVRLGGEEFLFVVAEGDVDGAVAFAERLRKAIAEHRFAMEGIEGVLRVTVSIGVAVFGLHGEDAATLLRAADEALYRAKRGGRDRVALSDRLVGIRGLTPHGMDPDGVTPAS